MQKPARGKMDFSILILTIILVLFGLVMVGSASYYRATVREGDSFYYLKRQAVGAGLGLICMMLLSNFKYTIIEKFKIPILVVSIAMLGAVFIPGLGVSVHESSRWLDFRIIRVQPAEVAKFALIIFVSSYLSDNRRKLDSFTKGVLPVLGITGLICALIYFQPNFSMIICIVAVVFVMLIAGGVKARHILLLMGSGLAAAVALIFIEDYRINRVTAFLDPWSDMQGNGYQLIQSFYAIASGGLFGRGLGMSQQKMLYLPFEESDFIFSIIAEELGFFGIMVLLALYLLLVWRGIRVALSCTDRFGSLMAMGISSLMALQVLINVAVVTGSIPPTGQPLPFISFGSSSLVIFMSAVGILLNISKYSSKN